MKFIVGTKQNMTQIFDDLGKVYPVTIVKVDPLTVVSNKEVSKDGYEALVLGYGTRNSKNISKPVKGNMKGLGDFKGLIEFKTSEKLNSGDKVDLSSFNEGDAITVTSISKGKGFQGVVKRHGFAGGPRTHGQKHSEREPGSIGGGGRDGGRVAKGKRMAGRMGSDTITIKGLKIVKIDSDNSLVYIKGAIAGRKGTLIKIKG
jgi:large subunit ribosomal protein L3